jgi:hypothetical protein
VVGTLLGVLATPAYAVVSDCEAKVNVWNEAFAICRSGIGSYRVAAKCDAPKYPYSITIYGPWKYRQTGDNGQWSAVDGDNYNCHIVKAWPDAR